jgi:hypothetical protein
MAFSEVVESIIKQIEERSGYPVETVPDATLKVIATVKMASDTLPAHVIRYNPSRDAVDYHIAFQGGFVLRLYEDNPESRRDFAGSNRGREEVRSSLLANTQLKRLGLDATAIENLANKFFDGLMLQLRSMPIGMRIDDWIWKEFPSLRSAQMQSIDAQIIENVRGLAPDVKKISPSRVWTASVSMSAAYAMFFERMTASYGKSLAFRSAGFEQSGESLLGLFDETPADATSDRQLVDAWANRLEVSEWYEWIPLSSN